MDEVFVSRPGAFKLGVHNDKQIWDAYNKARVVIGLMTPHSIYRPYCLSESGGAAIQAAAKKRSKSFFVARAKQLPWSSLPAPISFWPSERLDAVRGLGHLCMEVTSALGSGLRRRTPKVRMHEKAVVQEARGGAGDWSLALPVVAAKVKMESPFSMQSILRSARKRIIDVGQNLYYRAREENTRLRRDVLAWLRGSPRGREFRALILDYRDDAACEVWSVVMFPDFCASERPKGKLGTKVHSTIATKGYSNFDRHLWDATRVFRRMALTRIIHAMCS